MKDIKTWARDIVRDARRTGSTTQIARAAVQGRTDVAVVLPSSNAALDFRTHYLVPAAVRANLAVEQLPKSPAIRIFGDDGTNHYVYVLVAGQDVQGLPAVPLLFDPAVVYLVSTFGQGASPVASLREIILYGTTAGTAGLLGLLLRPHLGRWAVGAAVAVGTLVPALRALRRLRRR